MIFNFGFRVPCRQETFTGIYSEGVFVDGALHWLSNNKMEDDDEHNEIVTFDVSKEVFVKVIPSVPPRCIQRCDLSLQVLGGRLVLCETFYAQVKLSHTVKHGQHFAWTKLYNLNFSCSDPRGNYLSLDELENVILLEQSKDGNKILLQTNHSVFLWYDLKQGTFQRADTYLDFPFRNTKASFCWESLVSLGADRHLMEPYLACNW